MKRTGCIFWLLLITFFSAASSYNVFEENGNVGLKDEQGKVLIPARYEALGWSDGNFSTLNQVTGYKLSGQWGLIHLDNHTITNPDFDVLLPGEGSLVIARKKSNLSLRMVFGCLNTQGKVVIPFEYDGLKLTSFRAIVFTKIGNEYQYGLIDLENKTLIPQQFKSIRSSGSLRFAVENFDRKTALFTENGKQMTPFAMDSISSFRRDFAIIYQQTRQGLVDREGLIKAAPVHREIKADDSGVWYTRSVDDWLFLDGQNNLLKKTQADQLTILGKKLLSATTAGWITLEDDDFKPISSHPISALGQVVDGKAIFRNRNKYGVLRRDGTILLPAAYDSLYLDTNHFIANQRHDGRNHWHVLDSTGQVLSSKSYEVIHPFTGKVFPVVNRNFWGALNASGKETIACAYDAMIQHHGENIVVKFHGAYGVINQQEAWKVTPRANPVQLINDERYLEITPRQTYLKSFDGNTIYFSENKLDVQGDRIIEHLPSGTMWEIDMDGVIVHRQVQPADGMEKIYPESEGLRAIRKNGQYGFIDEQGRLRIANRYDDVRPFTEGMAAIKIRGHWGFINHQDNIAIQPVYDEVTPFQEGHSLVKQRGLQGLIDKQGTLVLPTRYDAVEVLSSSNVLIKQNGLFGLADKTGRILIHPKYDRLVDVGNNYAIAARDGKFGVISVEGISTIPMIYDTIQYDPYNNLFVALAKAGWVRLN